MNSIIIKQAVLFDGSGFARTFHWNEKKIRAEEASMKRFLIKKYGDNVSKDFHFIVFSHVLEEKTKYIKITSNGIENIDWFHPMLKKDGILENITDDQGQFLDGTIVFSDTFWKNLDRDSEMKIIDCIFEKAKNNENIIFSPYYRNCFHEIQNFYKKHTNDYSCKLTKQFSFDPSDLTTIDSKLFFCQKSVFHEGLLELEKKEKTIKG